MPIARPFNRPLLVAAGLCGATGVALAAAASHAGKPELGIAANFLQFHAPALIGISLLATNRVALAAGWVLVAGLIAFAGDLASRAYTGGALFPLAAPIGGTALIIGWLLLVAAAWVRGPRADAPPS